MRLEFAERGLFTITLSGAGLPGSRPAGPFAALPAPRRYVAAHTLEPLAPCDMFADPESEVVDDWLFESQCRQLDDEFEDITDSEKAFMKLWNAHVLGSPENVQTHRGLQSVAESFCERRAPELLGLRAETLAHFLRLCECGRLDAGFVARCMRHLAV